MDRIVPETQVNVTQAPEEAETQIVAETQLFSNVSLAVSSTTTSTTSTILFNMNIVEPEFTFSEFLEEYISTKFTPRKRTYIHSLTTTSRDSIGKTADSTPLK